MSGNLDELLATAAKHKMTAEEVRAQKLSWIRGQTGQSDEQIFAALPELASDPRDAELTRLRERVRVLEGATFQSRVQPWMLACFGAEIAADSMERNHRFIEEALELVQACGATADECHQLVDYVYGRPAGDVTQEVGGVMVTLAALCLARGTDMHTDGETELIRIWTKVEQIRAKQAAKPRHSPLPEHPRAALNPAPEVEG